MNKQMNEICKALGVAVISVIAILIIIRTLSWQQNIIKRVMVTREGFGDIGDSDSDSDSDSDCDLGATRTKIYKLVKINNKNKKDKILSNHLHDGEEQYYKKYYDSDESEWDTGSETEADLTKICKKYKKKAREIQARKEMDDIKSSSSNIPSSSGGGGMF